MAEPKGWQVSGDAAEVYERFLVPAIFGQWAPCILHVVKVGSGDRVLEVGCGIGALARAVADRVIAASQVVPIL